MTDWAGAMKEIPVLPPAQSMNPAGVERHVPGGQYGNAPGELEAGIILQNWVLTSTVQTSYWKTLIHLRLMCWTWSFFSVMTSLLSIFKHWHLTDLFILKVDFVPVEALQPLLRITLSGEQTDCKEVDGCLPEVSSSLSVISPFLLVNDLSWLGF